MADERAVLIRIVRQRLESLARAGVGQIPARKLPPPPPPAASAPIPRPTPPAASPARVAARVEPPTPPPVRTPAPTTPPMPAAMSPPPILPTPAPAPPPDPSPALSGSLFDEPILDAPAAAPAERAALLARLAEQVSTCARCPHLAASRTQTVFGEGSPQARLMFIGEAPGADEDRTGRPFVGRAGQLLNDMISKGMGLERGDVYIANILKSRPPENRTPLPDEIGHCLPYLERQIEIIRPEYLCLLGKTAASALLETALPMSRLRGKWHRYRGIPVVVTYHPAYLLRNPASKREAWDDLQMLMKAMGLKPPGRAG